MSMPKPPLMLSLAFIAKTTTTDTLGRTHLKPIDKALAKLDFTPLASTLKKIGYLEALIGACAVWRANKAPKLIPNTPAFSQRTADRAAVVDVLADQAIAQLKWYRFDLNKTQTLPHVPTAQAVRRGLQHGHQREKELYLQNKAQGNKNQNFGGGSLVEANLQTHLAAPGNYPVDLQVGAILNAPGKSFAQLNLAEFETLSQFYEENNASMQNPVHYADKTERITRHMVTVILGRIRKEPLVNYTTQLDMWALDKYGNFMCTGSAAQAQVRGANYQYNHSSLNAGHDVICAGTVKITNGIIDEIDNNSGHYRPTRINLHTAVNVMHHDLGMVFAPACVVKCQVPPRRQFHSFLAFLANAHAPGIAF